MKRAAARVFVVLAAISTIATSPKRWSFEDMKAVTVVLDDERDKGAEQLTVTATHEPEIELTASVPFATRTMPAEVRIVAKPDDGSAPVVLSVLPALAEAGATPARARVTQKLPAAGCAAGCTRVYRVSFERVGGTGRRLEVTLEARATVRGTGDEPPGAGVQLRIDRAP